MPKTLVLSKTSLATVESLAMPRVQEVVISADLQCAKCQKSVADIISRMTEMESVVVNVLEKKVTLTCRCSSVVKVPSWRQKLSSRLTMFVRKGRSSSRCL